MLNKIIQLSCIVCLLNSNYSYANSEKQKEEWNFGVSPCYYISKEKDTLSDISNKYSIPLEKLLRINNIKEQTMKITEKEEYVVDEYNRYELIEGQRIKLMEECGE